MITQVNDLALGSAACAVVAVVSFSGAVRSTFKLQSLRQMYEDALKEPVPDRFLELLRKFD